MGSACWGSGKRLCKGQVDLHRFGGRARSRSKLGRFCSRWIERWQEACHSALLMCVSRSQNARQSCKLPPPPPGKLTPELPPLPTFVDKGSGGMGSGDGGAMTPNSGTGAPIADAGFGTGAIGGVGRVVPVSRLEAGIVRPLVVDRAGGSPFTGCEVD